MKLIRFLMLLLAMVLFASAADRAVADTFGSGANAFDIEFVTIGNPGNAPDADDGDFGQLGMQKLGSVDREYRIGKYEISEGMINKANAEAGLGITHWNLGENKPVSLITWFEAAKFINYLNTSTGHAPAYKFDASGVFQIWQPGDIGFDSDNFYRNSRAKYFLPSADEWYKAAYFDPTTNVYYDYPTGSNVVPDGIDFPGDPNFDAVFADSAINNAPNDITNVGVPSPYGTFGQGGNNSEWEESDYDLVNDSNTSARGLRGGNWNVRPFASPFLHSSYRSPGNPAEKYFTVGFRVASKAIPEPSALLLGALASAGLLLRRRLAADFSVASAI